MRVAAELVEVEDTYSHLVLVAIFGAGDDAMCGYASICLNMHITQMQIEQGMALDVLRDVVLE